MTSIAGLGDDQRQRLAGLLRRCAVQVQAGGTTGTGFFIAPQQVMTCRHVVSAAIAPRTAAISVTGLLGGSDEPRTVPAAVLAIPPGEWPDIAILKIAEGAADSCVILDACEIPDGASLMTGGYPAKAALGYQAQKFTAGFPAHGKGQATELRIAGDVVIDGMSGSPVVSLRSGLVVGLLRITKGSGTALGGFSTMLADVLDQVPLLQPLVDRPPAAARQWIKTVGATSLKEAAGRDWKTGARWSQTSVLPRIDLTVEQGHRQRRRDLAHRRAERRAPATPAFACSGPRPTWVTTCLRAIDGWSRRQMITHPEEVKILGMVLDRALIAGEARTAVDDDLTVPPFLLRVCVDNAGGLSQLPWEYAWGRRRRAALGEREPGVRALRGCPRCPARGPGPVRVLAVIEIPEFEQAEFRDYEDESGRTIHPVSASSSGASRRPSSATSGSISSPAVNMSGPELKDKLAEGWDVVHYLGFAWATSAGRIVISVGCGQRTTFNPISIGELRDDYLALSECSVFIAEFHRPPLGPDLGPPADPSAFTGAAARRPARGHRHPAPRRPGGPEKVQRQLLRAGHQG